MSDVAGPGSLDGDLREHIFRTWAATPAGELRSRWVMSPEWLAEVRRLDGSSGPLYQPDLRNFIPEYLFGIPIEVRDDGGVPHLER